MWVASTNNWRKKIVTRKNNCQDKWPNEAQAILSINITNNRKYDCEDSITVSKREIVFFLVLQWGAFYLLIANFFATKK